MINVKSSPGVYIITCLENGASYVGSASNLRRRLGQWRSRLQRGECEVPLLQEDWVKYGPGRFSIKAHHVPLGERESLEEQLTIFLNSLEERGGYNKAVGRIRGVAARARDTEAKLARQGRKFSRLKTTSRLRSSYAQTICQSSHFIWSDVAKAIAKTTDTAMQELMPEFLDGFKEVSI